MYNYLSIVFLFIAISFNGYSQDPVGTFDLQPEEFIGEDFCFSYDTGVMSSAPKILLLFNSGFFFIPEVLRRAIK